MLTPHDNDELAAKLSLIGKHSDLQTIADPTALASDTGQRIDAVMQPAGFDITAYAAINNVRSYEQAGVGTGAWNARSALAAAPASSNSLPIAWQGKGDWTRQALSTARKQGYQYVIAGHDFDSSTTATVHTGTYTIPTSAGDITVLSEQKELGDLAKGKPTSSDADGETSNAGRIARFVAQSAFYQMEQPYAAMNRNLLVCFGTNMSAAFIDTLMTAVEQSSWLQLTDLNDLIGADAYRTGDEALRIVPQDSHLSERNTRSVTSALESLAESRNDINRFATSVLTDHKASASWIRKIKAAQSTLALHALSSAPRNIDSLVDGAKRLGGGMFGGVSITPTDSITVVSETAKMPVTVRNNHPYPVRVKVSSLTDSMEIVTSRFTEATIPANSEAQVTFAIRVATSGHATAHITLLDRNGDTFGSAQNTDITSVLRISDMTGFIIIGFSLLLGLVGLWRQFHRKKDPDE